MRTGFVEVDDSRGLFYIAGPGDYLVLRKGGWEQCLNVAKVLERGEFIGEGRAKELADALGWTAQAKFGELPALGRWSGDK